LGVIINNSITLFEDKSGLIWIGTENGLCMYNPEVNKIDHYIYNNTYPKSLSSNNISCVYEKDNNLWVGDNGITRINLKTNEYVHYQYQVKTMPHIFVGNSITSICPSENGYMFFTGIGLYRVNFDKGIYEYAFPEKDNKSSITDWVAWQIHKGQKSGKYWVATMGGFNRIENIKDYNPERKGMSKMQITFKQFIHDEKNPNSLITNSLCTIFEDKNGLVWVGSDNGLSCYNITTDIFKNYTSILSENSNKIRIVVKSIYEDHGGEIWIGTEGLGLLKLDNKKENLLYCKVDEKADINVVWGITEDDQHNLWLSTSEGMVKYNPKTEEFRIYDQEDGFLDKGFNYNAFCKGEDGKIYVGGKSGLNAFNPNEIKNNLYLPNVFITGFKIFNKPISVGQKINGEVILSKNIINTENITLTYKLNVFSIEFVGLHYYSPSKNNYKYMLEGFDKDWSYTSSDRRLVTYTNLTSGNYSFRVKASNCDGLWNPKETILKIEILPPFWQTWWFRIILVVFIIGSFVTFYLYRINSVKKKNILLERLVTKRTHEIQIQKEELEKQAYNLQEINILLNERQEEIQAASEELRSQSDELFSANNELLRLNATKDKFFSIIAHDLKNPFQGILSFSELLYHKYEEYNDADKKNFIKIICDSSKGAYGLLENLLEWSRSQTNKIKFDPRQINIYEIISETFNILAINANNKHITLINEGLSGVYAFADNNMITTVIRNLISNAIKFTPEGGKITINISEIENMIEIKISDTGIGMNEETVSKLFRIEQHITTTGTSGESGTGIGLIICKEFIDKNNGNIRVESKIGYGTSFFINIPLSENKFHLKEQSIKKDVPESMIDDGESVIITQEPETDSENKLVLIVEDNPNIRLNISQGFLKGYEIKEASNGKEGLAIALEFIPDLIISDVMMPEMDGFELCEKIKKDERISHIPVILLTARVSDNSRMKGLETGADDYITKPFNIEVLKVRVKNLLRSRLELQKKFSKEIYLKPLDIQITSADELFIQKALLIIEKHMSEPSFGVEEFSKELGISTPHLYRKIKGLTGESTNDFIRTIRLKRAAQLLISSKKSISEIVFEVGFNDAQHFRNIFKKLFGVLPTEYRNNENNPH